MVMTLPRCFERRRNIWSPYSTSREQELGSSNLLAFHFLRSIFRVSCWMTEKLIDKREKQRFSESGAQTFRSQNAIRIHAVCKPGMGDIMRLHACLRWVVVDLPKNLLLLILRGQPRAWEQSWVTVPPLCCQYPLQLGFTQKDEAAKESLMLTKWSHRRLVHGLCYNCSAVTEWSLPVLRVGVGV